jgi:hypothetical protein
MRQGAREALCWIRVAALAAGVACLVTFVVARQQPAAAASVRTRIDALIRDAVARHSPRREDGGAARSSTPALTGSVPGQPRVRVRKLAISRRRSIICRACTESPRRRGLRSKRPRRIA